MEPEVGDYVYYLPQLYEVKAVVQRGVYRICGVKNRCTTVMAVDELYPTTLTQRPPITTQEWNRMKVRLENSEQLGVASLQLQEQLKSVQQENSMLQRQVVELKQQLIVAEQQREHFRARNEANNSLVELECQLQQMRLDCESARTESDVLSGELKSALKKLVEYEGELEVAQKKASKTASRVRKLEIKLEAEINAKELTARRLQDIEKKLPGTGALSIYDLIWIFPTATIEEIQRRFRHLSLWIHPDKEGPTERFQLLNQIRSVLMDDGARNI